MNTNSPYKDPFDDLFIGDLEDDETYYNDNNLRELFKNNDELYQDLDFENSHLISPKSPLLNNYMSKSEKEEVQDKEITDSIFSDEGFLFEQTEPYDPNKPSEIIIFIGGHGTEYYGPTTQFNSGEKLATLELMKQQNMDVAIMNKTNVPLLSGISIGNSLLNTKTDHLLYHNAMTQFDANEHIESSLKKIGKRLITDYREVLNSIIETSKHDSEMKFKKLAELNLKYLKGQNTLHLIKPEYEKNFNIRPSYLSTDSAFIFYGIHVIGAKNVLPEYAHFFQKGNMISPMIPPEGDDAFNTKPYEDLISAYEKRHMVGLDPSDEMYVFHRAIQDMMVSLLNPYVYEMWLSSIIYALYGFGFRRIFMVDATCRNANESNLNYNPDPRLKISPINVNENAEIQMKWDKINRALRNVRRSEMARKYSLDSSPIKIKRPDGIYKRTRSRKKYRKLSQLSKKMDRDYTKRRQSKSKKASRKRSL